MTTGELIKKRRIELDMTQAELAKRLGYTSTAAISRVEKGVDIVRGSRLAKFAKALSVDIKYFKSTDDELKADIDIALTDIDKERYSYFDRIIMYAKLLDELPDDTRKAIEVLIDNASK